MGVRDLILVVNSCRKGSGVNPAKCFIRIVAICWFGICIVHGTLILKIEENFWDGERTWSVRKMILGSHAVALGKDS